MHCTHAHANVIKINKTTGRPIKKGEMEIEYVSCELFHFIKLQGKIYMFPENYAQPGHFAYSYFL